MKILVAPLNWGLGHASRCIPLVQRFLDEGNEVILGGDGDSLTLLRKHFPKLRYTYLAPLNLRYSAGGSQVGAILKALPQLFTWAVKDHMLLQALLREEPIDCIVSDNRFGLYINQRSKNKNPQSECIYITHQLHIMLPRGWRWLEPLASRIHARIYARYNKVWVPDYEEKEKSLAGKLSHPKSPKVKDEAHISYIGPLSRFPLAAHPSPLTVPYDVVAVLSGPEPQRTLLEKEIKARYQDSDEQVLIVQGLMNRPNTRLKRANFTIVPHMGDEELSAALLSAKHIIARSGYSTIMDLDALGLFKNHNSKIINHKSKIELIPTPGQPEQEYLSHWISRKQKKMCKN